MDTLRNLAIVFISIAIVGLQGDAKMENGTANSQAGNASSLALTSDQGNTTEARNKSASHTNEVVIDSKNKHSWMNRGREGGGGGGGGSGWWKWGCGGGNGGGKRHHHGVYRGSGRFSEDHYKLGEFAQCMRKGRCQGMRLDCPLHCGGPCYYDCQDMCKAHCRRR